MTIGWILVPARVWMNQSPDATVRPKSKGSLRLSHLGGVTGDYLSRDPVRDTVSVREQLLEGAFRQEALAGRETAAPCWRRRVPAGASETGSYWTFVQSLPIETGRLSRLEP